MSDKEYCVEVDPLALALTRAPAFMGVNIRLFFGNIVLCALICINAHTFWGVPLFLVLHLVMWKLSVKEPNFFYLWTMSFLKTPPVRGFMFWGRTNSYEPW